MIPESAEKLKAFFETFLSRTPTVHAHTVRTQPLLMLDYDGTLAPFRLNRFEARPFARVREALSAIQRQGHTRMVVITGRPASEIGPLLGLDPALETWGLHGAERLSTDGRREIDPAPPAALQKLEEVRRQLQRDSFGGLFEDKQNACVMHWRGMASRRAESVARRTRQLFEPLAQMEGLGLLEFEAGLELRVGRDKGGAVEAILEEVPGDGPVAYLGDDLTDENAFRAVNALRSIHPGRPNSGRPHLSVLMRHTFRETDADIWLHPPDDLRHFLESWLRAVIAAADPTAANAGSEQEKVEELATV